MITVLNCHLTVKRRGGWSWGASRRELTERAIGILSELLLRRIGELLPADAEVEVTAPVRVEISLTREQFLEAAGGRQSSSAGEAVFDQGLSTQVDAAIRRTLLPELERAVIRSTAGGTARFDQAEGNGKVAQADGRAGDWTAGPNARASAGASERAATSSGPSETGASRARTAMRAARAREGPAVDAQGAQAAVNDRVAGCCSLIGLLLRWRQQGELGRMLQHLSASTLEHWDAALSDLKRLPDSWVVSGPTGSKSKSAGNAGIDGRGFTRRPPEAIIRDLSAEAPNHAGQALLQLRLRIAAAVEIAFETGLAPGLDRVRQALDVCLPMVGAVADPHTPDASPPEAPSANTKDLAVNSTAGTRPNRSEVQRDTAPTTEGPDSGPNNVHRLSNRTVRRGSIARPVAERWEVKIPSALPFLILGPLAELGYLDTLAVSLEAVGIEELAPAFAAALAYKVLDPPQRGWLRDAGERRTAAALAGRGGDVPDPLLARLAAQADTFVSPLNATLAEAVVEGHDSTQPFLVARLGTQQGGTFCVVDVQGGFPAVLALSDAALADWLKLNESALLLVEANAASPSLLADLHRSGQRFLIDVPPTRGESWRVVSDRKGGRWWTNDVVTAPSKLIRQASGFSDPAEVMAGFFSAVHSERPAVPNAPDPLLESALTLAAGVALAQIAWDLWQQREPTGPLLTLERLTDLDAHVTATDEDIRVRLPLGRRSMDLSEHGYLQDIAGVPWLGDRVIRFSKG